MKKAFFLSCLTVLLAALPADAQVMRRPFFQRILRSPIVHELVNFGISQVLPNFPLPTGDAGGGRETRILVDSSVSRNLEVTADNLSDARSTIEELLKKNNLRTTQAKKSDIKQKE